MKIIGLILIVAGFAMLLLKSFNYTKKEKLVDAGPLEISTNERKTITWPVYSGVIIIVTGIALVILGRKKN